MPQRILAFNSVTNREVHITFIIIALIIGVSILILPPYAPFLLLGFILLLVLITERPAVGLLLLVLAAPFMNIMVGFGRHPGIEFVYEKNNLLIVDIILIITLIGIAIGRVTDKVEPFKRRNVDLPIILLTAYSTITLIWAKELIAGFSILLQFLSCILLFYIPIILLRNERMVKTILWIWLLLGVYAAVVALLTLHIEFKDIVLLKYRFYLADIPVYFRIMIFDNVKQRVAGLYDPNRVSYLLNTVLMAALALLLTTKRWYLKGIIFILILFIFYTDIHALSKGGLGSLIITFIMYVIIHPGFKKRQLKALAIFFIVFVTLFTVMSIIDLKGGFGRFGESPVETRGTASLALRFKWWSKDFKELFLTDGLGTGIGGMAGNIWAYAQSSYFSLLAELGLIGFFLALWLFFTYATELYFSMKAIKGDNFYFTVTLSFLASVIIFLIHSLVDFSYILRIPWLMAGLAMATAEMGQRNLMGNRNGMLR